jgi:hypothetical protein
MSTAKYEIINHGIDYPCYWQGQGVWGFGPRFFECSITGVGNSAREAYDDAVEGIASMVSEKSFGALRLPNRPRGIRVKDCVLAHEEEGGAQWYVSILYNP